MDLSDLQLNRQLYKTQPQTPETLGAGEVAANLSPAPSTAIASGNSVTDVNTNSETINGASITPGTIPPSTLNIANWGWTQTCAFSVSDADTVAWGSGTFTSANGEVYSITGSNTGNMVARTYIYLDINVSVTAYQMSTSVTAPIGVGKVLIAVCENGSSTATYNLVQAHQIVGDNVIANTINGNRIVAGSVMAGVITADQVTAGTMTGSTVQTSSGADRVQLTASGNSLEVYKSSVLRIYLNQDAMVMQNSSGAIVLIAAASGASVVFDATTQTAGSIQLSANTTGSVSLNAGGSVFFLVDGNNGLNQSKTIVPTADVTYDLGSSSRYWNNFFLRNAQQPVLYFGYISGTTLSESNASWTITNPTTGNYTIAHNFGTTNYTIVATALRGAGAGAYAAKIQQRNSNDARVTIFDDTGALVASDFMFLITKI